MTYPSVKTNLRMRKWVKVKRESRKKGRQKCHKKTWKETKILKETKIWKVIRICSKGNKKMHKTLKIKSLEAMVVSIKDSLKKTCRVNSLIKIWMKKIRITKINSQLDKEIRNSKMCSTTSMTNNSTQKRKNPSRNITRNKKANHSKTQRTVHIKQ